MRRILLIALVLATVGCGVEADPGGPPTIEHARIGAPAGNNAALYFTATGADRLVGVTATVADTIELHETKTTPDGAMSMTRVESLDLDGTLELAPGGLHAMLVNVDGLVTGEMVEVTLIWEGAGEQDIEAAVVDPADLIEGEMDQ